MITQGNKYRLIY